MHLIDYSLCCKVDLNYISEHCTYIENIIMILIKFTLLYFN